MLDPRHHLARQDDRKDDHLDRHHDRRRKLVDRLLPGERDRAWWRQEHAPDEGPLLSLRRLGDVVYARGELDVAGREAVCDAVARSGTDPMFDMRGLTFMDCGGYGILVDLAQRCNRRGGSLSLRNAVAQPALLLRLVDSASGPFAAGASRLRWPVR